MGIHLDKNGPERKHPSKCDHPKLIVVDSTPPKFNIAPENGWLEDVFPIGMTYFQGLC